MLRRSRCHHDPARILYARHTQKNCFRIFRPIFFFLIFVQKEKKRNQMILLSVCACRESACWIKREPVSLLNCSLSLSVCVCYTHTEHCIYERSRLTKSVHEHRGSTPPTSTPNHAQSCPHSQRVQRQQQQEKSTWSFIIFLSFLISFLSCPQVFPLSSSVSDWIIP